MLWWPYTSKTLILPYSGDETQHLLACATKAPESYKIEGRREEISNLYKFNGRVGERTFSISKKVKYPQNFIPLIKGEIEGTASGSIVTVNFTLFFASWFLLILGSGLTLVVALIFLLGQKDAIIGYSALFLFFGNYCVAVANFNIHVKDSWKLLRDVLSF